MPENMMPIPSDEKDQTESAREFTFTHKERIDHYKEYLADSLLRDYTPERMEDEKNYRRELIACLDYIWTRAERNLPDNKLTLENINKEAMNFADCLLHSKVGKKKMEIKMNQWIKEQRVCHQNVENQIQQVNEIAKRMTNIPGKHRVTLDKLASQDHMFFNSFALYLAYVAVTGSEEVVRKETE